MVELAAQAESRLRDSLRNADRMLGDAETRRIDQLAQTRQEFQNTIRDMLAESVRTTSTLVSTQLVQIQATFDTRVSKLEAGAFTQAGKSSVADPALSEALARMTATMAALQSSGERTGGQQAGQGQMVGWIAAGVSGLVSIGILVAAVLALHGAH
jgi:DNA anti-recombination protein RmuC